MSRISDAKMRKQARKQRVRATVVGTTSRPRLNVFISNRNVSAQIIDDGKQITLASITTVGRKSLPKNLSEKASWAGIEIAKQAKTAKISRVVLDRNGRLYHGRVKALADSARKSGLEF